MAAPKIIIDTNILSYQMKHRPEAELYLKHLQGKLISITFITVGELCYWAEKSNWGEKKCLQLETTIKNFVVIPYDYEVAKLYGQVAAERERKGSPISQNDAWIAACALRHTVPLVTHNAKDFKDIDGLEVISERIGS